MQKLAARNSRHHSTAYSHLKNDFATIRGALADATEDVKDRVGEIINQSLQDMKDKSLDLKDSTSDYVARRPFRSIAIAAGTGFLLGLILKRRR